jgi:glycosyltransferase involved in cell wall biosynthesis
MTRDPAAPEPFLSLVIPAHNEAARLPDSLAQIATFVAAQPYPTEVIVVENASRDNTAGVVTDFARDHPYVRLLREPQPGKGRAVRIGVLAARGAYVFQCDADLSMPVAEIPKFLPPALDGYDVAIASREGPGARRFGEPAYRHFMGRVFNFIVQVVALPGIEDSQCGFKCYRGPAARQIFPAQTMSGWGFDVEVLFIARRRGLRVVEVPIDWYYTPQSKINPLLDTWRMLREVLQVRLNAWRGRYRP